MVESSKAEMEQQFTKTIQAEVATLRAEVQALPKADELFKQLDEKNRDLEASLEAVKTQWQKEKGELVAMIETSKTSSDAQFKVLLNEFDAVKCGSGTPPAASGTNPLPSSTATLVELANKLAVANVDIASLKSSSLTDEQKAALSKLQGMDDRLMKFEDTVNNLSSFLGTAFGTYIGDKTSAPDLDKIVQGFELHFRALDGVSQFLGNVFREYIESDGKVPARGMDEIVAESAGVASVVSTIRLFLGNAFKNYQLPPADKTVLTLDDLLNDFHDQIQENQRTIAASLAPAAHAPPPPAVATSTGAPAGTAGGKKSKSK